ncbi:MAG: hypothetical protein WD005_01290, partial [Haliea sp.]
MPLAFIYYGILADADDYFAHRLHERAWSNSDATQHEKALWAATQIIDTLNFKGYKATVFALLEADPDATDEEIREAEALQAREF